MINPLKIPEMLSQANQMQEEMQRKLSQTVVEGTAGGGAVTATMNGKKELLKLHIEPSAALSLTGGQPDVEMLEDLVLTGVKKAIEEGKALAQSEMSKLTAGMGLPPGLGL